MRNAKGAREWKKYDRVGVMVVGKVKRGSRV